MKQRFSDLWKGQGSNSMSLLITMIATMLMGIPAMFFHECGHIAMAMLCGVKVKKIGISRMGFYTVREPGPRLGESVRIVCRAGRELPARIRSAGRCSHLRLWSILSLLSLIFCRFQTPMAAAFSPSKARSPDGRHGAGPSLRTLGQRTGLNTGRFDAVSYEK